MSYDYYNGKYGLTGTGLKLIAIVTMLIDHIGAAIVERYMVYDTSAELMTLDIVLRLTGRIAFPIFCFCLVEGFHYTHSRRDYLIKLAIFGLVSEVPFDFAFSGMVWDPESQNVFFTLAIGIAALWLTEMAMARIANMNLKRLAGLGIMLAAAVIAELLSTDYGALGIFTIFVIYFLRYRGRKFAMAVGDAILILGTISEITAILTVPIIHFYNGKRGRGMKYFFYIFYPAHLLILGFICMYMNI